VNGEALNEVKFLWIGALVAAIIFATKTPLHQITQ